MQYIVKKPLAKSYNIFCTDGEVHADCFVGPMQFGARIYKRKSAAEKKARQINGFVAEVNDRGEEVYT